MILPRLMNEMWHPILLRVNKKNTAESSCPGTTITSNLQDPRIAAPVKSVTAAVGWNSKAESPNSNFVVSPSVLIYISAQCRAKRVLKMSSVLYFRWVHYGRDYQRRRGISRALDPNFSEAPFHGGRISIASS